MDEYRFRIFFSSLKTMENEINTRGSIEKAIIKIIDGFEKSMTEEQRKNIYDEFLYYERKRREHLTEKKHSAQLDEEKYREFLKDFFEEFTGW